MQLSLLDWQPASSVQPPKPGAEWQRAEIDCMVELYVKSKKPHIAAIAAKLGRTYTMVSACANRIGLSFENIGPDAKMRVCMPCRREFWSTHRGNRICPLCKKTEMMECA